MLTLKHLRTLRHVSILIDHHQGVRRCLVKVTEFKKKITEFKILKSQSWRCGSICYQQPSSYSQFSLKLCTDRPPRTLVESDGSICCMYTMYPPEDEHLWFETCRGIIFYKEINNNRCIKLVINI